MPEASEITKLVLEADQRNHTMLENKKTVDVLQCGPPPQSPHQSLEMLASSLPERSLARLRAEAISCRKCPLAEQATQVVFGQGSESARVMVIGDQPGGEEDLLGVPFVGLVGDGLHRALNAAGINRNDLYITNAVKHFKFRMSGKRRSHEQLDAQEISTCSVWLESEVALVDPEVIICLGLKATQKILNTQATLSSLRGRVFTVDGRKVIPTLHPADVLRIKNVEAATLAFATLVSDLQTAVRVSS